MENKLFPDIAKKTFEVGKRYSAKDGREIRITSKTETGAFRYTFEVPPSEIPELRGCRSWFDYWEVDRNFPHYTELP